MIVELDQNLLRDWILRYELASFIVERRMHAKVRDLMSEDLTVEQFKTLRFLKHKQTSTASELSEIFCVGKSSITAIITRLSDKGLIQRVPEEKDRRVINLMLTEEGNRICEELEERVQAILEEVIQHFDTKEATAFIETYEKLADSFVKS
ncbi:MarR family winged helix-turn-helix transcriptional regulator [Paenibacillus sp. GCM10027627]|uniref:MarR family winged helix-turn-helix transcriptional regulator n=1 Tax=unclassified Paenibacillus TaxID=185978 RepID=UPI00362A73ED